MLRKLKRTILAIMMISGMIAPLALPAVASAAPIDDACAGLKDVSGSTCDSKGASDSFGAIIKKVIDILSIVVGSVSVIMIIIGGFRYVVSNGDANSMSAAKNTILYALVGLVIVLFAQTIVRFVLTTVK